MPDTRTYSSPPPFSRTSRFAPPPNRWEVVAWWMGFALLVLWCALPFFLDGAGRAQFALAGFLLGTIGRWLLRNAIEATGRRMSRHG